MVLILAVTLKTKRLKLSWMTLLTYRHWSRVGKCNGPESLMGMQEFFWTHKRVLLCWMVHCYFQSLTVLGLKATAVLLTWDFKWVDCHSWLWHMLLGICNFVFQSDFLVHPCETRCVTVKRTFVLWREVGMSTWIFFSIHTWWFLQYLSCKYSSSDIQWFKLFWLHWRVCSLFSTLSQWTGDF